MNNHDLVHSNMRALRERYPDYADVLSSVASATSYSFEPIGATVGCRHALGHWLDGPDDPWAAAQREVASLVGEEPQLYIVLRPGLGYQMLAILETLERRGTGSVVLVVEDRLDLFKAAFRYVNWGPVFRSESSVLLLGSPEVVIEAFIARHSKLSLLPMTLVTRPETTARTECAGLVTRLEALSAVVRAGVESEFTAAERQLNERRTRGEPLRVLLAGQHGYLMGPFADGFRSCACTVEALSEQTHSPRNVRAHCWLGRIAPIAPDLILWMNRPELSRFASAAARELGIANVVWSVDSPRRCDLANSELSTVDLHLHFEARDLKTYAPLGARSSMQLSLGAGIEPLPGCGPSDATWPRRLGPVVSFVGSLGELRVRVLRESLRHASPADLAFLDELASEAEDPITAFERETSRPYAGLAVTYVDEVRTIRRRMDVLSRLPRSSLRIFGEAEWSDEQNPLAPSYAGRGVRYGPDLASIYYHSLINMNIFHAQTFDSTNSRVYDVLAAGGFLLTEDRPVLHREFEVDRHLVTFSSPVEAADKVAYYLTHHAEREAIAREGQRHVLRHHTLAQRFRRLLEHARSFMGPSRSA